MVTAAALNFIGDHYFVSDFTDLSRDTLIVAGGASDGRLGYCCSSGRWQMPLISNTGLFKGCRLFFDDCLTPR